MSRNSRIILAKNIRLDKGYKNILSYNENAMLSLVESNKVSESNNYSFIKIGGNRISVGIPYGTCLKANYIAMQNPSYDNKWFFAFIDNIEYSSEKSTIINFTIDELSTWHDYYTPSNCFVVREHVNDDTVGLHTVPENLETGEYIVNSKTYYDKLDNLKYVIQCTEWSTTSEDKPLATNFGGVYMAGGAYICDTIGQVVNILQAFAENSKSDAVYSLYMIPASMITNTGNTLQYSGQDNPNTDTFNIQKNTTINGYEPVNKKLLTFPFNYMLLSNNNGSSNILHYERFVGNSCNFLIKGVPTIGGSIKIVPTNYDNNLNSEEEGLIAGKFPALNWSENEFTNWLTQQGVNIGLGVASAGLTIIGGIGMMTTGGGAVAGVGAVVSGSMAIVNELGAVYQHSLQPNSAKGNVNGGDINVCDRKNGFYFYNMSIKQEYAKIIDGYFSRQGYKVNTIKIPNFTGRPYWNFVQIGIEENIGYSTSDKIPVPKNSMDVINSIFRQGTTIWHEHNNIGNFSLDNSI